MADPSGNLPLECKACVRLNCKESIIVEPFINTIQSLLHCVNLKLVCICPETLAGEPFPLHHILKKPFAGTLVPAGKVYFVGLAGSSLNVQPPALIALELALNNSIQSELLP